MVPLLDNYCLGQSSNFLAFPFPCHCEYFKFVFYKFVFCTYIFFQDIPIYNVSHALNAV